MTGLSYNNIDRNFKVILKAANVEPWADICNALRKSAEDDWKAAGFAEATYSSWMGHDPSVSRKHYVAPTVREFTAVAKVA